MSETFREFFKRRNTFEWGDIRHEEATRALYVMTETMADWMDELARRPKEEKLK